METPVEGKEDIIIYVALGICAMLLLAFIIVLLFFISRKRIIREKLLAQEMDIKHKSDLINYNIETQESERQRIARDLHDDVGSRLNLISMNLHRLKKLSGDKVIEGTEELLVLSDGVIDRVRKISHQLMPPVLEKFGLVSGIEEMAFSYSKTKVVNIDFKTNIERSSDDFPELERLNLFRICQELVSNAIKHGKANAINIRLIEAEDSIQLFFSDDGIGLQKDVLQAKKGMGILNIENRVETLGGTLSMESNADQGVKFEIHLPNPKK